MKAFHVTIVALVLLGGPVKAFSCSCASTSESAEQEVQSSLMSAEAVVLAEAMSVEEFPSKFYEWDTQSQRVRWKVIKSWKGPHSEGQVIVSETVVTCCLCGVPAKQGEVFLIFRNQAEPFSISVCSLSGPASESQTQISLLNRLVAMHNKTMQPTR